MILSNIPEIEDLFYNSGLIDILPLIDKQLLLYDKNFKLFGHNVNINSSTMNDNIFNFINLIN